ncbi:MAG: hypothetical protein UIH41_09680, partial [Treponemataceae bacterium]|nr:hypothetical protein [Treponemataceae bacterium]
TNTVHNNQNNWSAASFPIRIFFQSLNFCHNLFSLLKKILLFLGVPKIAHSEGFLLHSQSGRAFRTSLTLILLGVTSAACGGLKVLQSLTHKNYI